VIESRLLMLLEQEVRSPAADQRQILQVAAEDDTDLDQHGAGGVDDARRKLRRGPRLHG